MNQKKKPFGLNSKAEKQYFPKTPRGQTPPKIKLTPMSGNKSSAIPNILDDNDVDWKGHRERSVTPPLPRTPSLPKPTKTEVNMLGFTSNQMYFIFCIGLSIFSLLCLAAADTIKSRSSSSQNASVLYHLSAFSACVVIILLLFRFFH